MIISENYPYLKVKFNIGAYESRISAYLDTGFDGYLVVPISLASSLGQGDYLARWELGDGCIVEAFEYLGVLEIVGLGTAIYCPPERVDTFESEWLECDTQPRRCLT